MNINKIDTLCLRFGAQHVCLDCAAAVGGERSELPQTHPRFGQDCLSCVTMAREAGQDAESYAEEQAVGYNEMQDSMQAEHDAAAANREAQRIQAASKGFVRNLWKGECTKTGDKVAPREGFVRREAGRWVLYSWGAALALVEGA